MQGAAADTRIYQVGGDPVLRVVEGPGVGGALVLRPGAYTVGRAEGCDLVVPDPGVSRQHVRVRRGPEGTELEDLGSTNGTYVNGLRVNRCRLRHRDRVRLGKVVLEYREVP